jgi:hypothetical protein
VLVFVSLNRQECTPNELTVINAPLDGTIAMARIHGSIMDKSFKMLVDQVLYTQFLDIGAD